jgi:hypothetical protein
MACDGRDVPTAQAMRSRVVPGRPGSMITCPVLAWLTTDVTAQGTQVLVLL